MASHDDDPLRSAEEQMVKHELEAFTELGLKLSRHLGLLPGLFSSDAETPTEPEVRAALERLAEEDPEVAALAERLATFQQFREPPGE